MADAAIGAMLDVQWDMIALPVSLSSQVQGVLCIKQAQRCHSRGSICIGFEGHSKHSAVHYIVPTHLTASEFSVCALQGGMPGAERLRDCAALGGLLKQQKAAGRHYAAICASPAVVLQVRPPAYILGRFIVTAMSLGEIVVRRPACIVR